MGPISRLHSHPLIQTVVRVAQELCVPVYLVGGAVRDALCDIESSHDFDFALAEGFDELVTRFARENRGKIIPWDIDQKRIVFRQDNVWITVDFSRMSTSDILYDLKQRDFTLNAMALAVHEKGARLIDPLGGKDDLSAHCLRMCSGNVFEADPLRMLRAVRFARQLSCVIEPATRERMRLNSSLITRSARERIKREFFIILQGPSQELSLRELHACGLLEQLLPRDVLQGIAHDAETPEVKFQTAGVLENMLNQPDVRLDGLQQQLCEFVGKDVEDGVNMVSLLMFAVLLRTACTSEHDTGAVLEGDTLYGKAVQRIARDIGLGRKAQNMLACLVENHERILHMTRFENVNERMKVRFGLDCGEAAVGVCLLAIADSLAAGSSPSSQGFVDIAYDVCAHILDSKETLEPLLTGDDVIGFLGVGAGPRIGGVLGKAAQLERDGILHNREAALLWLEKLHHDS